MSEKLEELISLLYQDKLTQYGKRLLVENIEKLQKENEELRAKWNKDTHILQNELDLTNADKINNYIPVQKVKEKIKELETELKKAEKDLQEAIRLEKEAKAKEGTILWWTAQIRLDERIKTLKEILRRIKKDGDNECRRV